MIELVFVIVILGILASIAVPKLVATKDDAGAVKAAQEMSNVITELVAFYTVRGQFEDVNGVPYSVGPDVILSGYGAGPDPSVKRMSATLNEVLGRTDGDKWTDCVNISINNAVANITIVGADSKTNYCKSVVNVPAVAQWISQSTIKEGAKADNQIGIIVGGSSIFSASGASTTK